MIVVFVLEEVVANQAVEITSVRSGKTVLPVQKTVGFVLQKITAEMQPVQDQKRVHRAQQIVEIVPRLYLSVEMDPVMGMNPVRRVQQTVVNVRHRILFVVMGPVMLMKRVLRVKRTVENVRHQNLPVEMGSVGM